MHSDTRRHLIALALLLAGGAWANLIWARQPREARYRPAFDAVPRQVASLRGKELPVEQRIFDYLGADAMLDLRYTDGVRRVDLTFVYGTDWRAVHSPLSCLPQQGWQVDERKLLELPAPPACPHPGPISGQLLRAHKPSGAEMLVLYVFAHKGGTTGDWVKQGWAVSQTPRGTGGLMLLLSTPVVNGDAAGASKLLEEVFGSAYTPAVSFWYR